MEVRRIGGLRRLVTMLVVVGAVATLGAPAIASAADGPRRPNVVIILGDDMGFSDMGMFGSEIKTPNLDALAKNGVRFTNFYTHASCSPTRSMLLSGVDTHINGIGNMDEWTAPNQRGVPGYEGFLNDRVVTLPQLLKDSGYHTYMVGKWHMGKAPDKIPAARGFERDFSLLDGAGSYWNMDNMAATSPRLVFTEDGRYLTKLPKGYYATKTYTDKLISFIDANKGDGKPFFAYVAHQAPHDPYHLPKEWRDRHVGEYDKGWNILRQERLKRQNRAGHRAAGHGPRRTDVDGARPHRPGAGGARSPRAEDGTLRRHDGEHGLPRGPARGAPEGDRRIREHDLHRLRRQRRRGGRPLPDDRRHTGDAQLPVRRRQVVEERSEVVGRPGLVPGVRPGWAQVSMTPFSQYKGMTAEGGIRNALVVSGPVVRRPKGSINGGLMHVADIMPTLLELAGASYPATYKGHELPPLIGKSWTRVLAGSAESPRTDQDYMAWEIFGNRAVRQGDWKLRWQWKPWGKGDWELFNVSADPGERKDVAADNPEKAKALLARWEEYAKTNNVILPSRSVFENSDDVMPARFPDDAGYPPLLYMRQFFPPPELTKR